MTSHPNFDRTQAALNASRQGDYAPAFDALTDDVLMENGPGAGPWHRARGKDDLALLLLEFASSLGETFHQDGWPRGSRSASRPAATRRAPSAFRCLWSAPAPI